MKLLGIYVLLFGLVFTVFLINYENTAYGQYRSCIKPDEKALNFQNTKFTINFEGNGCEYSMVLNILQEGILQTIDLNEKVTGRVSMDMQIIQGNLYVVWNDLKPIEYNKKDLVDPGGTIFSPSHFLTDITLKKISLDGKSIGKDRELNVQNYYNHRLVNIVEINDKIWLFWHATDSRTNKQSLIKTKIIDEYFVDHNILVKDRNITGINKILNLNESDLYLFFL